MTKRVFVIKIQQCKASQFHAKEIAIATLNQMLNNNHNHNNHNNNKNKHLVTAEIKKVTPPDF